MSMRTALFLVVCMMSSFSIQCKTDSKEKTDAPAAADHLVEKKAEQKVEARAVYESLDDAKPLTIEKYKDLIAKYTTTTFCETVYTCPEKQMPAALAEVALFATKGDCFANYSGWGSNDIEAKYKATKAGRLKFDADQAKICLESVKALGSQCDRIHEDQTFGLADCDNVHIPQQKEGDACNYQDECELDLYCEQEEHGAPGICQPNEGGNRTALEGAICEYNLCANGLICKVKSGDEMLSCHKFKRSDALKEGDTCIWNPNLCASGLTCSGNSGPVQCEKLKPLADQGQPCDLDTAGCKLGLVCNGLSPGSDEMGTCGPPEA